MADDPTPADRHRQRLDLAVVPEAEHKKVLDERDEERVYNREKQQRILEGIVREEALKRQRDEAQAALRKAELERDELRADLFIPGEQECPECGFSLSKLSMRAADGAVGVNAAAPLEPCPNGCGPMIGVTWKRGCTNLGRVAEEMSTLRQAAEVRADTAEADVKRGAVADDRLPAHHGLHGCDQELDLVQEALGRRAAGAQALHALANARRLAEDHVAVAHGYASGGAGGMASIRSWTWRPASPCPFAIP
jgi:hypothetical protein